MTEPYYSDEAVTLYHGDALRILSGLPTGSVNAVIADPPYSSGGMIRGDRTQAGTHRKYSGTITDAGILTAFSGDSRDQRGYHYWCALWISESLRIVHPGGICALFTDWRQLPATTDAMQSGGFVWRGIVPWAKPNYRPQSGRFAAQCEYVVWGSSGPMPVNYDHPSFAGFFMAQSPRDKSHITQKPLDVMRELVKIVPEGGVILDPFMGSGTTGVAAVMERRRFIGVEMNEHYAEVASRRILTAVQGYKPQGAQTILGVD
jgi:site-specific DNA-methyltransferase (adenine-specific)